MTKRIALAIAHEKELVIDPDFFLALRERLPRIGAVDILLKRGRSDNELTHYRYDVVLHVGEAAVPAGRHPIAASCSSRSSRPPNGPD